jgi:peptidoglycan/xylan/chitin deacetylase (PgdA/CDA1 family)
MTAVADAVFDGAVRMQVDRWLRHRVRHEIVIVTYHGFSATPERSGVRNFHGKHVAAGVLRRQLEYLKRHHSLLSLTDLLAALAGQRDLPPRPAMVTVDDGYRSTYTIAFPLLRELAIPAAVFVTTDFVGGRRTLWPDRIEHALATTTAPVVGGFALRNDAERTAACRAWFDRIGGMATADALGAVESIEEEAGCRLDAARDPMFAPLSWDHLGEMRRSGLVEIGSHSVTHPLLARCDRGEQEREIAASKREIETMTDGRCDVFCYPGGQRGEFDDTTKAVVRGAGYRAALTTIPGVNPVSTDPFELRRFTISDTEPFATFVMKMYGVVNAASRVKAAVRAAIAGGARA